MKLSGSSAISWTSRKLEESRLRLQRRRARSGRVPAWPGGAGRAARAAQDIELTFEANVDECAVWCDIERIERVFINLLSNATKFTPPRGEVTVTARRRGRTACGSSSRTPASGFPPDMAEKVFERFFQVDMAGTRKYGGTGIGLALAKELVELHGGTICRAEARRWTRRSRFALSKDREHFGPEVLDRRGRASDRQAAAARATAAWPSGKWTRRRSSGCIDIDEATDQRVVERDLDEDAAPAHACWWWRTRPTCIRVMHLALRGAISACSRAPDGAEGARARAQASAEPRHHRSDDAGHRRAGADAPAPRGPAHPAHPHHHAHGARRHRGPGAGLETGVNAYLAKPFSAKELGRTVRAAGAQAGSRPPTPC